MASGTGTATIDFGAFPGANEASVAVTGIGAISSTSKAEAWIMGDSTSTDHTANDHRYVELFLSLTCGTPTTGVGFTIYGTAIDKLAGKFTVHYVWAD